MKKALPLFFGIIILIFCLLLYWSSLLVEKDLKALKIEINSLQNLLDDYIRKNPSPTHTPHIPEETALQRSFQQDPTLPNLLEADPYYTKTLPKLLGTNFKPYGIRQEALLGRPENLHPFNAFRSVSTLINMCNVGVAELQFGTYEKLAPGAALKIEERDNKEHNTKEFWVFLRDNIFWQPLQKEHLPSNMELSDHFLKKHPLTAHDFKFFFNVVMNPNVSEAKAASLRNYYGDIEEFKVLDDLTFVVRWKAKPSFNALGEQNSAPRAKYAALSLTAGLQPLPRFVFQHFADGKKVIDDKGDAEAYRINSVFAQNFSHHFAKNLIVSCGAWIFDGMTEEGITFRRNPDHYNPYAVLVEKLHYTFRQSQEGIWQDFKAGKIDLCTLAPSQLPELENFLNSATYTDQKKSDLKIATLDFVDQAYSYIGWNQKTVFFSDATVRRAMTMGIDRNRIIAQNLNDMGIAITGPFFRYSPSYDATINAWPFDPEESKKLLDEAGWIDHDGDGIRDKVIEGKSVPFRFTLIYYAKNLSTKVVCDYIATALKEIGVDCRLNGVDIADLSHSFDDKNFDAIYLGWALGTPPEDPKQLWHSQGSDEKGSSNAVGFSNKTADAIIESLLYEYNKEERNKLYHKFHKLIFEENPYTFLYSPKTRLLYREYVKNLFIPRDRQDLVPGAEAGEPDLRVIYLKK